jgi:hypothetical protein
MSISLERQLSELHIPENRIAAEVDHCSQICYGSDTKRSVLGSMNDLVFQIKTVVAMDEEINIVELERSMRRTPFSAIGRRSAGEAVKDILGNGSLNKAASLKV